MIRFLSDVPVGWSNFANCHFDEVPHSLLYCVNLSVLDHLYRVYLNISLSSSDNLYFEHFIIFLITFSVLMFIAYFIHPFRVNKMSHSIKVGIFFLVERTGLELWLCGIIFRTAWTTCSSELPFSVYESGLVLTSWNSRRFSFLRESCVIVWSVFFLSSRLSMIPWILSH